MTSVNRNTLGNRVKAARLERGLTQKELGKAVGKSKQLVCAWEGGRAEILASSLALLGKCLSVDIAWLLYGKNSGTALPALPTGSIIPLLTSNQLLMLAGGRLLTSKVEQRTFVHGAVSEKAFATYASDDGMCPYISSGDIVTVDPDRTLQPGETGLAVVFSEGGAKLKSPVPLIRQVHFRTLFGAGGRLQLVAAHQIYPSVEVDNRGEAIILGRVVGVQKFHT
jgi:transcriptional regulator with XRE-family HTH domain